MCTSDLTDMYICTSTRAVGPRTSACISVESRVQMLQLLYVPLCVGRSKGKVEIPLKYYPENRDTFEMYPGKVMHIIGG